MNKTIITSFFTCTISIQVLPLLIIVLCYNFLSFYSQEHFAYVFSTRVDEKLPLLFFQWPISGFEWWHSKTFKSVDNLSLFTSTRDSHQLLSPNCCSQTTGHQAVPTARPKSAWLWYLVNLKEERVSSEDPGCRSLETTNQGRNFPRVRLTIRGWERC